MADSLSISAAYEAATVRQQTQSKSAAVDGFRRMLRQAAREAGQRALGKAGELLGAGDAEAVAPEAEAPAGGAAPAEDGGCRIRQKLNEAISVALLAPLLSEAMGKGAQSYFLNSSGEQAYARQLYMEVASEIGRSGKLPLGKTLAQAMLRRMGVETAAGQ